MTRLACALIVLCAAATATSSSPQVFRAAADVVSVEVAVTDGNKSVASLQPANFEVLDNGVAQRVTDIDFGKLPMDVRFVLDTSGSITETQLAQHTRAIQQVSAALRPDDRCEVSQFRRRATDVAPLHPPPLTATIARTGTDGTGFYDAVSLAMITNPQPGRRQLTIVLTDGIDTSSFFDFGTLMDAARRTDAVVYTITSDLGPSNMYAADGMRSLKAVVALTGGRAVQLESNADLSASFLKTIEEFRQSYVLHYTPSGVARPGWHTLVVHVRADKKYDIRAKQGYDGGPSVDRH